MKITRPGFLKGLVSGLAALAILGAGESLAQSQTYKPLKGFAYGPYRDGQDPDWGLSPTESQIREDLGIMHNLVPKIRTYGVDDILYRVPEFCNDEGIDCYPGTWIDDAVWDQDQINLLIGVGQLNYSTTKGLIVGNEFLYRHPSLESTLLGYLSQVKTETGKPVTAAEQWHVYRDHPNLASNVDFIMMHVHPYWENQSITNAAQFVVDKYNYVKGLYPGKTIIIGETGWPSAGATRGPAVPSTDNQKKFVYDFTRLAASNNIDYMAFEPFDESWKIKYGEVEGHWGLFDKNRALKTGLRDYLTENTIIQSLKDNKLKVSSFEGDKYYVEANSDLLSNNWQSVTNFTGASGTNQTEVIVPRTNSISFFRLKLRL
jgi:exo-beta-1,3-glucanase (GH17 family)